MTKPTYTIETVDGFGPHITVLSVREVACDTFVTVRAGPNGREQVIQLGVPLCDGCDEAVVEGEPCSCEVAA
jgi:hypothetical protein